MGIYVLQVLTPVDLPIPRQIALLKMHCTQTAQDTAEDAVQILGGRGITRTGMGKFVEQVRFST